MRVAALALVALAATGCQTLFRGQSARIDLEISVTVGDGQTNVWTLQCSPPGRTLPRPERACARLAQLDKPFAPVARNVACTQIYGGPQTAEVHGTFRDKRVDARFNRRDGCEIVRWNRLRFLFQPA